jgi:ATP/ADP translocase
MEPRFFSDALCLSCSAKTLTQSILAQERIYVAGTEKETRERFLLVGYFSDNFLFFFVLFCFVLFFVFYPGPATQDVSAQFELCLDLSHQLRKWPTHNYSDT